MASDHTAGHAITLTGTAPNDSPVVVNGHDPKNGNHVLGHATASSSGKWTLKLAHGVLYNTVVQATSGTQKSNKVTINVHQVLNIKGEKVTKAADGEHCTLSGSSASHIPGEVITVVLNGKVIGKGKMHADGTFTVKFVVKKENQKATLKGTGKSGGGTEYTLAGQRSFRA